MTAKPEVILVHGLWFGSWAMAKLARKLESSGFSCHRFSYRTTGGTLDDHAAELEAFVGRLGAAQVHFACHSLGGLVTLRMLQRATAIPRGRVVLLGSPLGGSVTARKAEKLPGADKLLGEVRTALRDGFSWLPSDRQTGMIAGTRRLGLGMILGGPGGAGDGTVAIAETRVAGLSDRIELPVTHTGMLYSAEVARQVANFLRTGAFRHGPAC